MVLQKKMRRGGSPQDRYKAQESLLRFESRPNAFIHTREKEELQRDIEVILVDASVEIGISIFEPQCIL